MSHKITNIKFQTAGVADRDCELKFQMGNHAISIDITKSEEAHAQKYYRIIQAISREQAKNAINWEFSKLALDSASKSMRLGDAGGKSLPEVAGATVSWLQENFEKFNPTCYKSVIITALEGP
jgi:hypothetical protein